jgi:hypothetical protein
MEIQTFKRLLHEAVQQDSMVLSSLVDLNGNMSVAPIKRIIGRA